MGVRYNPVSASGEGLLVVRRLGDHVTIEFPIGTVIYSTPGWVSSPRFSPDGRSIAFLEHPVIGDDGGMVVLLGPDKKKRVLTQRFASAQGLVWSPRADEIFYTATAKGNSRTLNAVTLGGRERLVVSSPGTLTVYDAAPDGRLLLAQGVQRLAMFARTRGDKADRDLSWLDWTLARDVSADGKLILFEESGEGGNYQIYVRGVDDRAPVRLGPGTSGRLSPDGRSTLAIQNAAPNQIFIYPVGTGESRQITHDAITHQNAAWLGDGKQIVFIGYEPNQRNHLYIQDLAGGAPRAVIGDNVGRQPLLVSPDGKSICVTAGDGHIALIPLHGGSITSFPELAANDRPIRFSADGESLLFYRLSQRPAVLSKIDFRRLRRVSRDIASDRAMSGKVRPAAICAASRASAGERLNARCRAVMVRFTAHTEANGP